MAERILLVSDSEDERDMYAQYLRARGFGTVEARTADDAYRLAAELHPDAVVTDMRLAGNESGLQFTRRLKQHGDTRHVPVVILSACVFTHDRESAARAGCDLFLAKPCLPDALSNVLSRLIARRRA